MFVLAGGESPHLHSDPFLIIQKLMNRIRGLVCLKLKAQSENQLESK